jgi:hypothetical protein
MYVVVIVGGWMGGTRNHEQSHSIDAREAGSNVSHSVSRNLRLAECPLLGVDGWVEVVVGGWVGGRVGG